MPNRTRSTVSLAFVLVLAGCATNVTTSPTGGQPSATAAPAETVEPSIGGPSASIPGASPSGTPVVVPTPMPVPATPGPGGFVATVSADTGTAWTSITWHQVAATDPRAHIRATTHWSGGDLAFGDPETLDGNAHTPVWISIDGLTWNRLPVDRLGSKTIVVGAAATANGVVALTVQSGFDLCSGQPGPLDCWTLTGPLQAWTSTDDASWTAHPGPNIPIVDMSGSPGEYPVLMGGTAGHLLAVTQNGLPLAVSHDGIAWQAVSTKALPTGWRGQDVIAIPSGLSAIGSTAGKTIVVSSSDGKVWTSHTLKSTATGNGRLVSGPTGVIATSLLYLNSGAGTWIWWSSLDGLTWLARPGYPPLGTMSRAADQECRNNCANGNLVGDGQRMVAYRGWATQAGWTSSDGRSWQRLTLSGRPETSSGWLDDQCTQSLIVTAIGLSCTATNGSAWFGTPG